MAKTKPEAVPLATPAAPREPSFDATLSTWTKADEAPPCPGYYPTAGPLGDLMAAEAVLDLLRLAVEKDFAGDRLECRQESAVVAAAHALRLVHRARLAYAEALAVAVSGGVSRPAAR
jgi:hypothetical protein